MLETLVLHVYGLLVIGTCIVAGGALVLWLEKK